MRYIAVITLSLVFLTYPAIASQERSLWDNENIHTRTHPAPAAMRQLGPFWATEMSDGSWLYMYDVTDGMAMFIWDRAFYWYCANEAPNDFFISGPNSQGAEPVAANSYEAWQLCQASR
jgi:hypothetical protein